jgi:tripeptidyl-peptidase II
MRRLVTVVVMSGLLFSLVPALGEEVNYYDLLSRDRVGARDFTRKHPTWDGRGTVVAVLDTGVDMSVPGLLKTTTGETKVIEARDFTGQGVIHLRKPTEAKEGGEPVLKTGKGAVRGFDKIMPKPDKDSLLLGVLEEKRFQNSSVNDINENGKTDDRFAILVGKIPGDKGGQWVAWVDTDADGHVDDEEMQEEYSHRQKHFFFTAQVDERGSKTMAVAMHIEPKRREVELHFADGSHGSHVAGIAAGHELFGKKNFDGIAPGAWVMSLKIGDNTLSGGSTTTESMKRALEFAGSWSQKKKIPVIVNMSYGIGTELEGDADIDRITDRTLQKYPLLSVSTSAGNSGPGLSTVGTPAGADLAFSTGAVLTRENASSLYGTRLARDVIFYFSSRGGELAKPDGLAPGCAASSVPPWDNWVIMRGTSMASPQTAGCLSLLASAAIQQKEMPSFTGGLLARALRNSGKLLPGYSLADQGPGMVNVPAAWKSLQSLSRRKAAGQVAGFQVHGDCPTCPSGRTRTAFFRAGTYLPARPDSVSFTIRPLFMTDVKKEAQDGYFESIDFQVVDGDWLELASKSLFLKGASSSEIDLFLKPDKLKKPGLYTARILGTSRETGKGQQNSLLEMWAVVIVPHVFDLSRGFARRFAKETLAPGEIRRYFFRVPEGAASMRLELLPVDGKYTQSRLTLFDPEGHEYSVAGQYADSTRKKKATALVAKDELKAGIWEAVVITHYAARKVSSYTLDVEFSGFHYDSPKEFYYDLGSAPRAGFQLKTLFDKAFEGRGSGGLFGIYRSQRYTGRIEDRISFPVILEKDTAALKLKFAVTPETYARFTDCAINVLDHKGNAVDKGGFGSLTTSVELENPTVGHGETNYTVEIIAGFAERREEEWGVTVEEYHHQVTTIPAKVWCDGYAYFTLYPNRMYDCEFELQDKPGILPESYLYFGELRFKNARSVRTDLIIPLKMQVGE